MEPMNDETAPPSEEDGAVFDEAAFADRIRGRGVETNRHSTGSVRHMGIDRGDGDPWEGLPMRAIYWTLFTLSASSMVAILVLAIWFTPSDSW